VKCFAKRTTRHAENEGESKVMTSPAARKHSFTLLAQVASASVVALTLLFVGLQVREANRQTALNTVSLQVAALQELNAQITHFNELLLDPQIAMVWEKMLDPNSHWPQFSVVERRQALALLYMLLRHSDMAYYQYAQGMLAEERLASALAPFVSGVDTPVFREFWEDVRANQVPAFREELERRIADRSR
jgi:hypothetical protein